jgi:predicted deacylase
MRTALTIMEIGADDFDPGRIAPATVARYLVKADVGLPSPAGLPALIVRGRRPGPTAMLVAGVHGDEFEGIAALPQLVAQLDPENVRGTVLALPVCNPLALAAQSRCSPESVDGVNLARVFPGDPVGSPTRRLAATLFSLVSQLLSGDGLFADLHSAGTRYRYLALAGFRDIPGPARDASEEAARHFGTGQLWRIPDQRGTFNAETTRAGVPTVGIEAPGQGGCLDSDVDGYVAGLRNVLAWRGILDGPTPARNSLAARCPTELTAPADGLFLTGRAVGDQVSKDDLIGRIVGTFGEVRASLRAPHAGQLWALRTFGSIHVGELAAWVCPAEP